MVKKVKCGICDKEFEATRNIEKYCSDECRYEAQRRRWRSKKKPVDRCKCKLLRQCYYTCYMGGNGKNGTPYCGFMEITGHMRGGYPDECTHYRERERKNGNRNSTDMYSTDCAWK